VSAQQVLVGSASPGRPAHQRGRLREALVGWAFSAPFLILFLVFLALPILASFVLSFTDFSLGNLVDPLSAPFVGLKNYVRLFHDAKFLQAAFNTGYFVIVGVALNRAVGLAAAVRPESWDHPIPGRFSRWLLPARCDQHHRGRRHLALPVQCRFWPG